MNLTASHSGKKSEMLSDIHYFLATEIHVRANPEELAAYKQTRSSKN